MKTELKKHRLLVAVAALCAVTVQISCTKKEERHERRAECCRDIQTPIWYDGIPSHTVYEGDSYIKRIDLENGVPVVTINVPRFEKGLPAGHSMICSSKDIGEDWNCAEGDWGTLRINVSPPWGRTLQAPDHPAILYKYLDEGLFLRSEDGGRRWKQPRFSVDGMSKEKFAFEVAKRKSYRLEVTIAAIDPTRPLTVYATLRVNPPVREDAHGHILEWYEPPGLYVSHDGGETWSKFTEELRRLSRDTMGPSPMGISPSNPSTMFGEGRQGVVKSTDAGKTWRPVGQEKELEAPAQFLDKRTGKTFTSLDPGVGAVQFLMHPSDPNTVYIISAKGVYRTFDGGQTWCLLNLGFDVYRAYHNAAPNPANPNEIFVGTAYGLFFSADGGCHFKRIYPAIEKKATVGSHGQ